MGVPETAAAAPEAFAAEVVDAMEEMLGRR
jgi:hypothetical protein